MTSIAPQTEPVVPKHSNPYVNGNYAPIDFETTSFALPITGTLPAELTGRLVRIGPNPSRLPDAEKAHWFTGLGMVHGVRFAGGRAEWYRSRYVRAGSGARVLGIEAARGPANRDNVSVNTTVLPIGRGLFACVEAGAFPVELSYELDSVVRSNLGGGLYHGFAAHTKVDPLSGEQCAIAYQPGDPRVQYIVVDNDGVAHERCEIELPHMPLIHDTAITQSSVVVLDLPVTFEQGMVRAGNFPYAWNAQRSARVGLLPRNGDLGHLKWFEAPTCFVFHIMNSYDDGTNVILDVVRHPRMFASEKAGLNEGKPVLARWTLNRASGDLSETIVAERACEFPRHNDAVESFPYRFGYTTSVDHDGTSGPIMKHDMVTGTTEVHDYGFGRIAQEPIFIARQGATSEDDGYVLSFIYDTQRNASDVVILCAQDFAGSPIATIELPVRVPFGFHGNWIADPQGQPAETRSAAS